VALVVATARLPFGYYTFTRIVTCGAASLIGLIEFKSRLHFDIWPLTLILVGMIFNPVLPFHLDRASWFYLDLAAAAVFISHLALVRQRVSLRIPTKPARHSNMKPATRSEMKPAMVPI
jgi:hypothetical protein